MQTLTHLQCKAVIATVDCAVDVVDQHTSKTPEGVRPLESMVQIFFFRFFDFFDLFEICFLHLCVFV